jgi:DNA-binding SARP family transcriptional activator
VSRLRRTLGDGDEQVLVTAKGGYVLALEPEQLDAMVFERLLDQRRALLASDDAGGAAVALGEALRLWHGPPLADLAAVGDLQPEIRRLEELRLLAQMELIDAELALGRAGEVVGELERLIARDPLKERLRGQLMLALYRSGRQADALATYRETWALLSGELGLTPGPELRDLERMILRHDEGLEPSAAQAQPVGAVVCPFKGLAAFESSDAEFFCGRARIVSELVARLAEWPLVGILGPSGSASHRCFARASFRRCELARCPTAHAGARWCCGPESIRPTSSSELSVTTSHTCWTASTEPTAS